MALNDCTTCQTSNFRQVTVDHTGTLAICESGHYNFDPDTRTAETVETGRVIVTGQSVIGGGVVIGHIEGDYRGNE